MPITTTSRNRPAAPTPRQHSRVREGRLRCYPGFFAILFAVQCALLSWSYPGHSASNSTKAVIYHLDGALSSSEAGAIIALNKGYFGEAGLDVRIVEGSAQERVVEFVANNPRAIGVASVFDFLRAIAAGKKLVAFASAYMRNPITCYARHDSNIRSVADFAGKTVAYDYGHPTAIVFDALLAKNQLSSSTIKQVSGLRTAAALASRQIDILPGEVGQESRLLNELGQSFDQINPDAFGLHLPGSVYFAAEDTLRNDPDLVRKFLRAVILGWDTAYRKNPEDLRMIATALRIPNAGSISLVLDQQRPLLRPSGIRSSELDPVYLNGALSVLLQQRLIPNPPKLADAPNFEILKDIYRSEPKGSFAN
jgi:ABC-type nitrate/sulfonate/bicarbonate transport system substrate-binding protein